MNATTQPPTDRRPKALLLDDDATVLRLLGTALEARGLDVRAASEGEGGLALLVDELLGLDVLVVDLELPGRDGWDLLHLVRRAGGERDLGIVVLANDPAPAVRAQLLACGADAVVDRRAGPGAAAEAVCALARRSAPAPRRAARGPASLVEGALLLARAALRAAPRLATAG
jgi:DNA-binding response OmpR family regulator